MKEGYVWDGPDELRTVFDKMLLTLRQIHAFNCAPTQERFRYVELWNHLDTLEGISIKDLYRFMKNYYDFPLPEDLEKWLQKTREIEIKVKELMPYLPLFSATTESERSERTDN